MAHEHTFASPGPADLAALAVLAEVRCVKDLFDFWYHVNPLLTVKKTAGPSRSKTIRHEKAAAHGFQRPLLCR